MTYQEVVKNIESRIGKFKSKGNIRIKKFLEKLGSPHKNLKVIHVAGIQKFLKLTLQKLASL